MILQALARYYQRLIECGAEGIAPDGYSPEKISFEIVLAEDGSVAQVNDIRDMSGKKPQPRPLVVSQPEKRTVGVKSNFLWDKTSYVLGVVNAEEYEKKIEKAPTDEKKQQIRDELKHKKERTSKEHSAFKALHETVLAGTEDAGLKALLLFLQRWTPEDFHPPVFPAEMFDSNVVFRLDGEYQHLHQREAAQTLRARLLTGDDNAEDSAAGICLVTGKSSAIARLHPAIKNVNGAQSSGASIVSFNLDAFTSYGKNQGENAPISEQAAFAYTSALNYLLRRSADNRQRLQVGDTTVVFWAEAEDKKADSARKAEGFLSAVLNPPADDDSEVQKIRYVLEGVAKGRPLEELDPELVAGTQMYLLGLAPNAARLSIRFWQVNTLGVLTCKLAQHREDLRLEPSPWKTEPSVWRLALATAPSREGRAKSEDVSPQLAGELMRAILTGSRYPGSLLANMVMRMRADGDISGVRVAICKAVLKRNLRIQKSNEEIPVSLNKQSDNPGYLLGRLFAVLESVQRAALGGTVNATIRDRYYGAASATPASIFPVLLRNTQNHLSKLRKEKPGLAVNLEKDIREIVDELPDIFPSSLKIEAQGSFAIGYYHQSSSHFARHAETAESTSTKNDKSQHLQGELL
jgi:CRISPR-associated protein Csd1